MSKRSVLGVMIDDVDASTAVTQIIDAAQAQRGYSVSALAVHGVMTGVDDDGHRYRLNSLDLLVADGQPVRWALNWLYSVGLRERVYGPKLMLDACQAAVDASLPIYLYGSSPETVAALRAALTQRFPGLTVAGAEPSCFAKKTESEMDEVAARVRGTGARLCFVGLGCPRQEVFVYENADRFGMPVIAVGAAFDYHAGLLTEPPLWVQKSGLQWLYRLCQDPVRLWRRYVLLNPRYLAALAMQKTRHSRREMRVVAPTWVGWA